MEGKLNVALLLGFFLFVMRWDIRQRSVECQGLDSGPHSRGQLAIMVRATIEGVWPEIRAECVCRARDPRTMKLMRRLMRTPMGAQPHSVAWMIDWLGQRRPWAWRARRKNLREKGRAHEMRNKDKETEGEVHKLQDGDDEVRVCLPNYLAREVIRVQIFNIIRSRFCFTSSSLTSSSLSSSLLISYSH